MDIKLNGLFNRKTRGLLSVNSYNSKNTIDDSFLANIGIESQIDKQRLNSSPPDKSLIERYILTNIVAALWYNEKRKNRKIWRTVYAVASILIMLFIPFAIYCISSSTKSSSNNILAQEETLIFYTAILTGIVAALKASSQWANIALQASNFGKAASELKENIYTFEHQWKFANKFEVEKNQTNQSKKVANDKKEQVDNMINSIENKKEKIKEQADTLMSLAWFKRLSFDKHLNGLKFAIDELTKIPEEVKNELSGSGSTRYGFSNAFRKALDEEITKARTIAKNQREEYYKNSVSPKFEIWDTISSSYQNVTSAFEKFGPAKAKREQEAKLIASAISRETDILKIEKLNRESIVMDQLIANYEIQLSKLDNKNSDQYKSVEEKIKALTTRRTDAQADLENLLISTA